VKIALVSLNAGPLACLGGDEGGGQSVVVDCLSRELARAGHAVTVVCQRDDPALPHSMTTSDGVRIDHVDAEPLGALAPPALAAAIDALADRLRCQWTTERPDVVHAHAWISGKAAVAAARSLDIPVVQTFHGLSRAKRGRNDPVDPLPSRVAEEAALVQAAARIIATSSAEVFALLALGASPGAVKLIPCGVDLELFSPAPSVSRPSSAFRVATLSRLVPDAGVADAIEALAYLDGVELAVGGGRCAGAECMQDPDARALATLATARGVAGRVTFAGNIKRDAVAAFLRAADAVICAPWYDSIGTVALEAMACGVPVIVSAVGSHVDAVADGISGLHVPAQAPRQIAYAIDALRADEPRRARFGRFGVERTSARYGWPRIAAETVGVYCSAAARGSAVLARRG
jgi:glycosyltransferase involved in cell wall biosynthesis